MNANIVVKLNSGESFVYANIDLNRVWLFKSRIEFLELAGIEIGFSLANVKEILIKPMPIHDHERAEQATARTI